MSGNIPKKFTKDRFQRPDNLRHLWEINTKTYEDKPFFSYKQDGELRHISFREMHDIIQNLGTAFFKIGVMGQNTALLSETRYEWLASYFAAACGQGIVVPLDKELLEEQILNFIERANVTCVVYSGAYAGLIELYAKNTERVGKTAKVFVNMDLDPENESLPEYKDHGIYSFTGLLAAGEAALKAGCSDYIDVVIDNDKPCAYLFTSGTTGTSKAVMLSHKNIASNAHDAACCAGFDINDTMVAVLPTHHSYETTCTFFGASMLGAHLYQNESIKMVMRNFQNYKPTKLALVPLFVDTMVKRVWDEIDKKGKTKTVKTAIKLSNALRKIGIDLRKKLFGQVLDAFGGDLNGIICGGAALNPEHIKTMDAFGIRLWQGYGITECSPLVSVIPKDMHMKKPGSVGYPVFHNEVKIGEKDENGNGEILVKGDNVMLGYLDNEEATKEVFTEDGFFMTGDIGYIDGDGYIYITGRKKNLIILSNGKNVYPEELEEYLYKIEGVKECAVICRKKDNGDENITALIFPDMELEIFAGKEIKDAEAIVRAGVEKLNKELPVFKQITEVEVRDAEFEKTTTKKIIRYKLK